MNILLIDDDPVSCKSLADFFQKKGYPFVQASNGATSNGTNSNGKTALDIARQHPISIIISSQEMRDMDGIELCRNIREEQKDNYIYFIMLAKTNEKESRLTGYHQGVDSYITNPPDLDELEALVRVGMRISGFNPLQVIQNKSEQTQAFPGQSGNAKGYEKKLLIEQSPLQIKMKDISNHDILFARIALEKKLVTKGLLAKAFSFQKKAKALGNIISIDKIFLEKEMISANKIEDLRGAVKRYFGREIGNLDLKKGFAIHDQVKSFDGAKEPKKNSITPSLEPDFKKTEQPGTSIEEMIKLVVSENKLEARIRFKTDIPGKIIPDDIIGFLNQNNIIFGIENLEQIAAFLNADLNEKKAFLVAKGKPATLGCDASLEYHFDTDHLKAGAVNEDGNIDYRERGESPWVQLGDLLAIKIPMKSGEPGIDVNGNPILVPDTNDINLKCGEGTLLSDNGLEVHAKIDGQPNLTLAGDLSVFDELIVDGDVDFNTGNIDFNGNVIVKGAIIDGFTIKCGNLNAKEVFGAKIFAIGDVNISGGIIKTQIKAEGNVTAKFITNSNIKSFGSILVEKEVLDSKIRSSGNFLATRGKIISSFISAKMGFESMEIGSDLSNPCRINVGMDENIKKRIQEFNYTIIAKREILENLQKNYEKALKQQAAIHFKNQEMLDEKITKGLENIKIIIKEIETISDEREAIIKWSKEERGIPVIKVKGSISHGTKMFGMYSSIISKETIRNVLIKEIKKTDADRWEMMISESQ